MSSGLMGNMAAGFFRAMEVVVEAFEEMTKLWEGETLQQPNTHPQCNSEKEKEAAADRLKNWKYII